MATEVTSFRPDTFERMERAVEQVKKRMRRAAGALGGAEISYAVVGGNAVAAWVAQVDPGAVRNTRDVDIALRREHFEHAKDALRMGGFTYEHVWGVDCFLDGPDCRPSEGVHLLFAEERVRPTDAEPFPSVAEPLQYDGVNFISLRGLVVAKLTSFRRKDQVHLDDLIRLRLVDESWLNVLPQVLAERFQRLLDHPE